MSKADRIAGCATNTEVTADILVEAGGDLE